LISIARAATPVWRARRGTGILLPRPPTGHHRNRPGFARLFRFAFRK
jgi:hypothetical protein